ncbi:MAG: hypothetical protein [Bacteriophage sp.]|nr:MAG: hypothetical protein [Bacteriophage sp.]
MANDVFIKNIPLSFLKEQSDEFFSSDSFNNAKELFDRYKRKSPLLTDKDLPETNSLYPINELKTLLIDTYQSREHLVKTKQQNEDLIFIAMIGKYFFKGMNYKLRKYITKTNSEINIQSKFRVTSVDDNILKNLELSKEKKVDKSSSLIQNLLQPDKTNNVVFDITNKSKFYNTVLDRLVYDDKEYALNILKSQMEKILDTTSITVPFESTRHKLTPDFDPYNKDTLEQLKKYMIFKLKSKYFDFESYSYNNPNIIKEDSNIDQTILTSLLSLNYNNFPLRVYRELILNQNIVTIEHGLKNNNFIIHLFDNQTGRLINDAIKTITHNSDNTETIIEFKQNVTATLLLLYDNISSERINQFKLLNYYKNDNSINYISRYAVDVYGNTTIDLHLKNYNLGYAFIEVRDITDKNILMPDNILFTKNKISLVFNNKLDYSQLAIYILPVHKILRNLATITLTKDNYKDLLNLLNPLESEVKIWRLLNDR